MSTSTVIVAFLFLILLGELLKDADVIGLISNDLSMLTANTIAAFNGGVRVPSGGISQ